MGTRNLTMVISKEEPKVAQYCQWDGYPGGQGLTILGFLRTADLKEFKKKVDNLIFMTDDQIQEIWKNAGADGSGWVTMDVSKRVEDSYPQLSRNTGADILQFIAEGKVTTLQNTIEFAKDSVFCEWAYVIDLDNNKLEIYEGFNKEPLTESDRFYFDGYEDKKTYEPYESFYPIKCTKVYDLRDLPSDKEFVEYFEETEDEE